MTRTGTAGEVLRVFAVLGLTSFGGPVAHLGYFRREFVERRGWLSETEFAQLLAICQFLPGPASSQLGFALGLQRAGWTGACAAFAAFTLPSALLLMGFAMLLPALDSEFAAAAIDGLKLVACAVVADAVLGMSRNLCPDWPRRAIAGGTAGLLLLSGAAWLQIVLVAAGAGAGLLVCRHTGNAVGTPLRTGMSGRTGRAALIAFGGLLLGLPLLAGNSPSLLAVADVFYRAGALVFGGGHVVLPLLESFTAARGWVDEAQFLAGYGAAQAVPGPLFTFAAYLGMLIPAGTPAWLTAVVALLFVFLPGLLLVAAVLPAWQGIAAAPRAAAAIAGINAAVVGILAAALYDPIITSGVHTLTDAAIAGSGFLLLAALRLSPLAVVGFCVAAKLGAALLA